MGSTLGNAWRVGYDVNNWGGQSRARPRLMQELTAQVGISECSNCKTWHENAQNVCGITDQHDWTTVAGVMNNAIAVDANLAQSVSCEPAPHPTLLCLWWPL